MGKVIASRRLAGTSTRRIPRPRAAAAAVATMTATRNTSIALGSGEDADVVRTNDAVPIPASSATSAVGATTSTAR